ncbi:hypothetical protein [Vibrio sp. D406a]|uniref:DUF6973 domain-containing protein n=1 Tax=Vibrio sp. D406a TaxID=2836435 RepID=UPI002553D457|nr:hypothetical protein [Vibrio sp. D406a]MDK9809273.1 hypothetical protein [Vibrio sp. D406a]
MVKHVYQQYNSLKEGEKEYLKLNPHHAIAIKDAKDVAFFETESRFGINGHNDKSDAFRHCFWSSMLARDIGYKNALEFTTAHEDFPENPENEKVMDLHNNKVGIRLGLSMASNDKLAHYCYTSLLAGRLKVIKKEKKK